ncbi:MAG TPA: hypothetical protein PKK06_02345 [Phycisphaerae bacterium]|nr:hypothetical protein [Phycisphaerae bacterium]HNU44035.1 hypothetical protein [Phycisphaerae bacterium]
MCRRFLCLGLAAGFALTLVACRKTRSPEGLYFQSADEARGKLSPSFKYMTDNAAMHDLSVADFHFVPHTSELSGVGIARLNRLSALLKVYGGTLRYETFADDDALVAQRLTHVRDYLAGAGCDMEQVKVEAALSGGRGMSAEEAIEIMERGTANPAGGAAPGMAMSPMGGPPGQ